MSIAEVLAEIEALPKGERVQVARETLRHLNIEDLKIVERTLRRLAHPEVPEEIWEDMRTRRTDSLWIRK